ncbi:lmo0937 family membrane protein [Winogradskyella epiphytica]|nr:lmo0937 family membrane protein [Winogradskyella epiphytica]
MRSLLYAFLVIIIILWALGYFVFSFTSPIHFLLLVAIIIIVVLSRTKS